MPTLNIKDPHVYELAAELAQARGTSMTAAVRSALEEAMSARSAANDADVETKLALIRAATDRLRAVSAPVLSDDDLYDPATGLPW